MTVIRKTQQSDGAGLNFILLDATPDSHDNVIYPKGVDLKNFNKNPVALFNDSPIGRWEDLRVKDGGLHGRLVITAQGASDIRKLTDAGILRSVSAGIRPLKSKPRRGSKSGGVFYGKSELIEANLVCVTATQNSLMKAKSLGVSTKMIREIFKEQNKNASLADRIKESRAAVRRYDEEERAAIHRKGQAVLARLNLLAKQPSKPPSKPVPSKADRDAHARASTAKAEAQLARAKAEEGYEPPKKNHTHVVWRGQRIPIPKWNGEDQF
jgi:hypothetical protein